MTLENKKITLLPETIEEIRNGINSQRKNEEIKEE